MPKPDPNFIAAAQDFLARAEVLSADLPPDEQLEAELLAQGREDPLPPDEMRKLLGKIVTGLKERAAKTGEPTTLTGTVDECVEEIMVKAGRAK